MKSQDPTKKILSKQIGLRFLVVLMIAVTCIIPTVTEAAKGKEQPEMEFGIMSDIQYCDCEPLGTRYYRNSIEKLQEASKTINKENVDFTIQTGDLIDRRLSSFATILPVFNTIKGPKYHVLGNHDFPVTRDEVIDILGMPNQYYDFQYKNWRYIVLDTNDLSLYANPEDSEKYQQAKEMYIALKEAGASNAKPWNGGISEEQLTWLEEVLVKAEKRNERVIVFAHHPVYPEKEYNVWNDKEVRETLESHRNVAAYFNGHNHAGNYGLHNGIHYVNLKGMVETPDTASYAIVKVYNDRIEIDGYGREQDRVLEIR
ncbi:phosphatase [Oceanobacillus piezotolerans]|uniref:Phosphatase n=1 Tax=Oceanobacillus piezotolerans TaxID=2448030 RepID=A0A498D1V4_9BACI|nr:metallophosphoesterase [Oceanobacillus piezotolerans]RLL41120.1 phosphatase [Oceanobacillus piezotolerans]